MPYQHFFKHSRDIMLIVDNKGRVLEANKAAIRAYGYSYDELLNLTVYDLRSKKDLYLVEGQLRESVNNGVMFETEHKRKDETTFPVEVNAQGITVDKQKLVVSIIRNISRRKNAEQTLSRVNREIVSKNEELVAANEELKAAEEELRERYEELWKSREALELSNRKLNASEARFRSLAENAQDMIFRVNLAPTPHIEYMNPATTVITGYKPEDYYNFYELHVLGVHPEDRKKIEDAYKGNFRVQDTYRWIHRCGHEVWLEVFRVPIYDDNGQLVSIQGIVRNINERKKAEERLRYLSYHDTVTNVYNRAYFEEELTRLSEYNQPIGLIIVDVDGLKLINDTFGHDAGDEMLAAVAGILRMSFRIEDKVARIGGDEFAIILFNCSKKTLEDTCLRIRKRIQSYNETYTERPLSISIGYSMRSNSSKTMKDLFKEADNSMYREKLHRQMSCRSSIVSTLMKAMEARDFITEGHGSRMQDLMEKIGQAVGMTQNAIFDLRLLAQFHDIGKVGIPDRILFKPGSLTTEERAEMQRHCEIGYRIAKSASELIPIADKVLKHHEWWNGQGYPLGLKGDEIPLECRILAIADAYDAMSNDRPYRKALPVEEVIKELNKCAGTQFDPYLVPIVIKLLLEDLNDTIEATRAIGV